MITQKQVGGVAAKSGSKKAADGSEQTPANVDAVVMADESDGKVEESDCPTPRSDASTTFSSFHGQRVVVGVEGRSLTVVDVHESRTDDRGFRRSSQFP